MANKIQIKRSVANASVTGLSNGELAFTQASNTLFIGAPDGTSGSIPIATKLNYGTLTANSVLVANSSSAIDKIITANLVPTQIYANGTFGTAGYVLATGGSGGNAYWVSAGSLAVTPAGSNGQIQYNASGSLGASAALSFNSSSNTLSTTNFAITGSLSANGGIGSAGQVLFSNGTVAYWATPSASVAGTNTQIQFNDGGVLAGSTGYTFDKTTNNVTIGVGGSLIIGNSTVNSVTNSTTFTGTANNASYLGGTSLSTIQGTITANASAAYTNAMADTLTRSGSYTGNNTFGGTNTVISSNLSVSGYLLSNLIPTPNNTLTLGNNTNRWSSLYVSGSTIYLGNTSISSDANNALSVANLNVTSTAVLPTIGGATTTISSNVVINGANVDATSSYFRVRDAVITGNLTINGTLTTIDTNNLQVKDSSIKLGDQQATSATFTDNLDFTVYGTYGNTTSTWYSGLYRDHAASSVANSVFKLFSSNTEPTSIVDNTAIGYTLGTLNSWLTTGAFVANATAVDITANSTVAVSLVANSLTLSTALAATSGGTGQNSYTGGDLLYASNSTNLSKLSTGGSGNQGYVLQVDGSGLPSWNTLDGGTF